MYTNRIIRLSLTVSPRSPSASPDDGSRPCPWRQALLIDAWVSDCGPRERILSDQGPQFMSNFFIAVMKMLGIKTVLTTANHFQTNGLFERDNHTMATQLRPYVADEPSRWEELLPAFTMACNSQLHRSMGIAPFELFISRRIPDLTIRNLPPGTPLGNTGTLSAGSPLARKRNFMAHLRRQIPDEVEASRHTQERCERTLDHRVATRNVDVKIGDCVSTTNHDRENKLQSKAIGPFVVVVADASTFVIDTNGEKGASAVTISPLLLAQRDGHGASPPARRFRQTQATPGNCRRVRDRETRGLTPDR